MTSIDLDDLLEQAIRAAAPDATSTVLDAIETLQFRLPSDDDDDNVGVVLVAEHEGSRAYLYGDGWLRCNDHCWMPFALRVVCRGFEIYTDKVLA